MVLSGNRDHVKRMHPEVILLTGVVFVEMWSKSSGVLNCFVLKLAGGEGVIAPGTNHPPTKHPL